MRFGKSGWRFRYPAFAKSLTLGLLLLLPCARLARPAPRPTTPPQTTSSHPSDSRSPCPNGHAYCLPAQKLAEAKALGHIRTGVDFGSQLWNIAVLLMLLTTGTAGRIAAGVERTSPRLWLQTLLFSASIATIVFLLEVPILAAAHAASRHYGISVQSWPSWLIDQCKSLGVTVTLESPLLTLLYGLMRWPWSRPFPWFWSALFAIPLMILGVFLLPALIEPIFDRFEPLALSHPALVAQLQRVVARTGTHIPPDRMFLMKAGEKSNGLNAYVTGIGASKRIVVWDTTADRMPEDEILFVFAHESGHYVLNHIPKGLALGSLLLFPFFFMTTRLSDWLIHRLGIPWKVPPGASLPGLVVFLLAVAIVQFLTEPIPNTISRHFEHQADVYGQEAIHGIVPNPQATAIAAFNDLGAAYLDDPDPSPFLEFWTYDHPSLQKRATFAAGYDPWGSQPEPGFFPQ